jgi:hypothetical protein
MVAVDFGRLEAEQEKLHDQYVHASPFPHIVIDDFLLEDAIAPAIADFPDNTDPGWRAYAHVNEHKFADTNWQAWAPSLQRVLADVQSPRFVDFLQALTGMEDLIIDESLNGGGLHQSITGGFLNMHADFTVHPQHRDWRRRVNLLIYLNDDWDDAWGGQLELWSTDMKRREQVISPIRNRAVIFTTDVDSFHGHPEPLTCPPDRARRSMALYYFSVEEAPLVRSTEYRARPGTGWRSALIYADKQVLRGYDRVKRRLGFSDEKVNAMLRRLDGMRRKKRS